MVSTQDEHGPMQADCQQACAREAQNLMLLLMPEMWDSHGSLHQERLMERAPT